MRKLLVAALALGALLFAPAPSWAAPNDPTGLVATVSGDDVILTWTDNSAAENGFIVERCTGYYTCTSFGEIGFVGANVTSFRDRFTVYSGAMTYRVRAFDSTGRSAPSNSVAVSWATAQVIYANLAATQLEPSLFRIDGTAFSASLFNPNTIAWEWSFGDGQVRRTSTPVETVRYGRDGTFTVSLRPINATGPGVVNSINVTAQGTPAPIPEITYAGSVGRSVNRIDWFSFPSAATAVEVLRCKGSYCSNFTAIATVPLSANRFDDVTAKYGTTYTYALKVWESSTQWFIIRTRK
jgi:hypothetical protein